MLEIKEIWKTFNAGTVNEKQALRGVTLTLNEGDFCTVIGGNGAGKSTMLNAVAGTWAVDAGTISIGPLPNGSSTGTNAIVWRTVSATTPRASGRSETTGLSSVGPTWKALPRRCAA